MRYYQDLLHDLTQRGQLKNLEVRIESRRHGLLVNVDILKALDKLLLPFDKHEMEHIEIFACAQYLADTFHSDIRREMDNSALLYFKSAEIAGMRCNVDNDMVVARIQEGD